MNHPPSTDDTVHPRTAMPASARFPVVGVGASAGGLGPTTELLRALGPEPGAALVVIHHLDPTHESSLVGILSRATPLPVHTAVDGVVVAVNQVYVVPPNVGLTIQGGELRVHPRTETGGLHLPIDRFFESLAADQAEAAIGVVLSGSGSDGTDGVKAIKAEGGVTLAQDSSAEYGSMPESAVATGCVDGVLPIPEMAREVRRLAARTGPAAPAFDDDVQFQRILAAMARASGIDLAHYKRSTVRRRVQRRAQASGTRDLREYADQVVASANEARVLADEVLIHVTSFFRDAETFDVLKQTVFPKILESRRKEPIRIWVPGCASGEEVYSLAMSLLEFLDDKQPAGVTLKLFGTDVSLAAIEKARAGKYPLAIERDVSGGRLQRFFVKLDTGYQVRKELRDLCIFARQDATRDPPFAGLDMISCRNLMIYLDAALQDRILPIFHYALREPGFLVLGTSETVRLFPGFTAVDAKNKIYARSAAVPRMPFAFTDASAVDPGPPSLATARSPTGAVDVQREADRLVLAEFAPPGVVITEDHAIVQFRGRTGRFLEPASGAASFDVLRMAREELRLPVRQLMDEARTRQAAAYRAGIPMTRDGAQELTAIRVIPLRVTPDAQRYFLVLFEDSPPSPAPGDGRPAAEAAAAGPPDSRVREELESTRNYLQSVIEQLEASNEELKAANEEIVSSNEELRSTNEELQMAKEELQATNEELRTVNEELGGRNAVVSRLNDDLSNVLSSVEIPIIILGRDRRLVRFTPAAGRMLRLVDADVGRPVGGIHPVLRESDLAELTTAVLERLAPAERTVQDARGRWYQLTVRPYLTEDNRIDGVVLSVVDVDLLKRGEQLLAEARRYAESVVDTVREALVVLDSGLRVRSANPAFHRLFAVAGAELDGKPLAELGHGEWNIPALLSRLEALDADGSFEGFRVEQEAGELPARVFLLNARRIPHSSSILLALDDVTVQERASRAQERSERALRDMLTTAAEAILMADANGMIVFANDAAAQTFRLPAEGAKGWRLAGLLPARAPGEAPVGRRPDGTEFPVETARGTIAGEAGPLSVHFVTDISQRRRSEEAVREYQRKLQQMAFDSAVEQERERRRIALDLHDRIGQALALAQIKLSSVGDRVRGRTRAAIDAAVELLAQSVVDTRSLTFELAPPVLYDLGLRDALSWLGEEIEKSHGLRVEVTDDAQRKPLDETTAALVFRAVREILINVAKHAHADSAWLSLRRDGDQLEVQVQDHGVGFDPEDRTQPTAGAGFGLFSVKEQIGRLGGRVDIRSAPGAGTTVTLHLPIHPARAAQPETGKVQS